MLGDYVKLEPLETVEGRPFTNPVDSVEDLVSLHHMIEALRRTLNQVGPIPAQPRPFILYLQEEEEGRYHRIAFSKPEALLQLGDLTVVAFCGQKRPGADRSPIDQVDAELLAEFEQHSYLLSYSTLKLEDGNACNLVLFSDPRGLFHWVKGTKHTYAAGELAPKYYLSVRLHNAILPGGLVSGQELVLLRTKYYDYQGEILWWGVRELQS
jgi:hypothetical protein